MFGLYMPTIGAALVGCCEGGDGGESEQPRMKIANLVRLGKTSDLLIRLSSQ